MILKDKTLTERLKLTASYPILLTGLANAGKTESIVRLPADEKKRTMVLNFDSKPIGLDPDEFFMIVNRVQSKEKLENLIIKAKSANNTEMVEHLSGIIKTSYFVDDEDTIDKICDHILGAAMGTKVDRIVLDTLTEVVSFCEQWAYEHYSGQQRWNEYGNAVKRVLQTCKEARMLSGKFVYIFAHYNVEGLKGVIKEINKTIKVKGGIMSNNVETMVTTVIEAYVNSTDSGNPDDAYFMQATNGSNEDTTRHKLPNTQKIEFNRNSIDDLEQVLSQSKKIVDFKVVSNV